MHDPAAMPDRLASLIHPAIGLGRSHNDPDPAYFLLERRGMREHGGRTMAGVPPSIKTIDAFVGDLLAASEADPGGVTPVQLTKRSAIEAVLPGEVSMAADFIELAIDAADGPLDCEDRRDARAWLQDKSIIYSARLCFEALGFDYDVVRKLLVQRWLKEQKA